jgi:nitrogen fixation/metabolism regulation signal transduction histidine kinase
MKKIRTKIIVIILAAVLLPIIPLSVLVFNLINQSYHVGVNPQVAQALENGLAFSKSIYDFQRNRLVEALERLDKMNLNQSQLTGISAKTLGLDSAFWSTTALSYLDSDGTAIWQKPFSDVSVTDFDNRFLKQFQSPAQRSLIVSDRKQNQFTAILKRFQNGNIEGYWVLQASFQENFLKQANHALDVLQMYQTLDLTRHELPRNFLYAFIALGLLILSLAVILGIWISARITSPLTSLVKGTAEIGRGNLDYQIPSPARNDEIGRLIGAFNQMAEQLKENQERMIYLEKMSAWKQMARKLAHEIKNPLSPIQLTVQQLVDKYEDNNAQYQKLLNECYSIINEEIGSLRKLVQEFSEFGRMPELNLQKGDLNELIREVSVMFSDRVELHLDKSSTQFLFDEDRIRRVMINLIQNAIQADSQGNPVKLKTEYLDNKVRISVSDQGSGIPDEDLPKIFEPHFTSKKEGMGLGLAITRLIVEEHEGTIQVHSKVRGGSEFVIELPVVRG